jgi:hypothetical protein
VSRSPESRSRARCRPDPRSLPALDSTVLHWWYLPSLTSLGALASTRVRNLLMRLKLEYILYVTTLPLTRCWLSSSKMAHSWHAQVCHAKDSSLLTTCFQHPTPGLRILHSGRRRHLHTLVPVEVRILVHQPVTITSFCESFLLLFSLVQQNNRTSTIDPVV